jgi:ribosome maturation factor RimP
MSKALQKKWDGKRPPSKKPSARPSMAKKTRAADMADFASDGQINDSDKKSTLMTPDLLKNLEKLITPLLTSAGYEAVRIVMQGRGRSGQILQIMIDRTDEKPVLIEDCLTVNNLLSPVLDEKDPLPFAYRLEISSPGIDRPLIKIRDYERAMGHMAKFELKEASATGQKKYKGRIAAIKQGKSPSVTVTTDRGAQEWSLAEIDDAQLLLTDELIKAHQQSIKD